MENLRNDNNVNNIINNKCIENHIADMLVNVLHDENKSETDISLISESQPDINHLKNNQNFLNENLNFYPKNNKNIFMKSNTYNDNFQRPEIFVNAPEQVGNIMPNRKNNHQLLMNNQSNNMLGFNYMNSHNMMKSNSPHGNFPQKLMPNINNLSPINKSPNNRMDEFNHQQIQMQKNRLHINYVNPNMNNQNLFFAGNQQKLNTSYSPRNMENNNNNLNMSNSPRLNTGLKNKSHSPRVNDNNNNPSPRQYNISYNDNNNFSTSFNR